jgi:hypothetical protein
MIKSRIKILVAQSADSAAVDAFLSSLLVLVLKVSNNDVTAYKTDFPSWLTKSSGILTQMGIKKDVTRIANKYILNGKFDDEDAIELGKLLSVNKSALERDNTIPYAQLALFKDCVLYLYKNSTPAWTRIHKAVSILRNSKINTSFLPDDSSMETTEPLPDVIKKIKNLVKNLTGATDKLFLNPQEIIAIRKDPERLPLVIEYSPLIKIINNLVKAETFKFVRASGNQQVLIDSLKDYLLKKKVPNNLPIGFTGGQIDEVGNMYTKEGRQLEKPCFGPVMFNPKYDPATDKCFAIKSIECPTMVYKTLTMNAANKNKRHALVKQFFATESASRKKWLADLSLVKNKRQVFAAMTELIYQTSCRIGGIGNATKGEPTYGLTTLQVRHLDFVQGAVEFNYSGKKAAEQHHVYKTTDATGKKVRAILEQLVKDKLPDDNVFTFKDAVITRKMCNDYLQKTHNICITAHRFRQLAGTKAAMGILKMSPFKKGSDVKQAAVDKWIKEEMKKVGEILHHHTGTAITGMTAIKSYIDPGVLIEFYTDLGLRVPTWVPTTKAGKGAVEESEED